MRYVPVILAAAMLTAAACGDSPTAPTPPTGPATVSAPAEVPTPAGDPAPPSSEDPAPAPEAADPAAPPPVAAASCNGDSPGIRVVQNLIHDGKLLVVNDSAACELFGMAIYLLPPGARDTDPQIPNQRLYAYQNAVIPRGGSHLFNLNTSLQDLECGRWLQFDLYVNMDSPPDPPTTEGFRGNQIDLNNFGGAYYQKPCAPETPQPRPEPIPLTCTLMNVSLEVLPFPTAGVTRVTVPVIARWGEAGSAQFFYNGTSVTPPAYQSGQVFAVELPLKSVATAETIEVKVTHPAGLTCAGSTKVMLPALVTTPVCPAVTRVNMKQFVTGLSLTPTGPRELAASFTITEQLPAGCTIRLLHDAWLLQTPGVFLPQKLVGRVIGEFGPGRHTNVLKVQRADCYWQNDLLLFDTPELLIDPLNDSNEAFYALRVLDFRYDYHGCSGGIGSN